MSLPHRIAAAFCKIAKPDDPKEAREPEHRISPGDKTNSNAGLKNASDETAVAESYGGGANAYFTKYPPFLVTKFKGSIRGAGQEMPDIDIEIAPFKNRSESRIIDNRSVPVSYDRYNETIEQVTQGKGEIIEFVREYFWSETTEVPSSPLYGKEYPTYLPTESKDSDAYKDEVLWVAQRFMPWDNTGILSLITDYKNKADYLCSMRIPKCDITDLWVRGEPPYYYEDPVGSNNWKYAYGYAPWNPKDQYPEESQYAAYYNVSTWRLRIKAEKCCWNKDCIIKGKIKVARRLLKFDPPYTQIGPGIYLGWQYGGYSSIYGVPYFLPHRFTLDENSQPDLEFMELDWEVTINDVTATKEWHTIDDIDIPTSDSGSGFELTYICGFTVTDVIKPPPLP